MSYSFSKISTYTQCALKYRYQYIDKVPKPDFEETADTILGNAVHSTLEYCYDQVNDGKIPTLDELLDKYQQFWIDKKTELGTIPVRGDKQVDDYIHRGKSYIESYHSKYHPFADVKVIQTELDLHFKIADDISFKGFADRLDKVGDSFVIHDYKTGKNLPSEEKDSYIEQLTLYGLAIKQHYGKYFSKLYAKLHFLHFDIEDEREVTDDQIQRIADKYIAIVRDIQDKTARYAKWDKKIFEPTKSWLCAYCPFQSICPLFNHIDGDERVVSSLGEKTLTTLVDQLIDIKNQLSELKKQETWLKEIFTEYMEDKETDAGIVLIPGTEKDLKITQDTSYKSLDKQAILEKVKSLWLFEQVAEVSHHTLTRLCKDGTIDAESMDDAIAIEPTYKITAVKKSTKISRP
jgi:putative RecB family exonuclease